MDTNQKTAVLSGDLILDTIARELRPKVRPANPFPSLSNLRLYVFLGKVTDARKTRTKFVIALNSHFRVSFIALLNSM